MIIGADSMKSFVLDDGLNVQTDGYSGIRCISDGTLMLTGATGFLGSHLLRGILNETGYDVIVLKRSISNTSRIDAELEDKRVISYNIDCIPLEEIFAKSQINIIVHAATNYGRNNENILELVESNLILPLNLLKLGVEYGLSVFVNTDTFIDRRINYYSMSKSQFLDWFKTYADSIKCFNLRLEHVYGEYDNMEKFVSYIVRSLLEDVPCIDLTPGNQKRHFIYVGDVVSAFICVIKNMESIDSGFSIFDISTEKSITIKDFVLQAKKMTGNTRTKLNFGILPYRDGEMMDIYPDIRPLVTLGWKPVVSLENGLLMMIEKERLKLP